MARNGKSKRGFIRYKSYLFTDRDPIIEAVIAAQRGANKTFQQIKDEGGPAVGTMRNWENGTTKRPMFCTVAATARVLKKSGISFGYKGVPRLVD